MNSSLTRLLAAYRRGQCSQSSLLEFLRELPFRDLGFAKADLHRQLRRDFPEVVYADGKTPHQIIAILQALSGNGPVLVTKVKPSLAERLKRHLQDLAYFPEARMAVFPKELPRQRTRSRGFALVVTAGTSDIPVAQEAALTLRLMGQPVKRLFDVGVAGVHRLLAHLRLMRQARVIVVVAGMDGVLPSLVSGLVSVPIVAVPTSVGYGASFKGVAPLLTMLNSCSPGVAVVNIDNGFGAGYLAGLMLKRS